MKTTNSGWQRSLRWATYFHTRSVLWPMKYRAPAPLLARHACLGADVLDLMGPECTVINVQKGRIDYMLDCWENPALRARSRRAVPHIAREAIVPCVIQEELLYDWCSPERPRALFMDSMAELADQRFAHKRDQWSFLCVYGDTTRSSELTRTFESKGLLPIDSLESVFAEFFSEVRRRFAEIPIFYLHFPTALETRAKYLERAASIRSVVDRLATVIPRLHSISIDESIVGFPEDAPANMEDFPYHYNKATYVEFARRLNASGDWNLGSNG
jgi:hypothetical protein